MHQNIANISVFFDQLCKTEATEVTFSLQQHPQIRVRQWFQTTRFV